MNNVQHRAWLAAFVAVTATYFYFLIFAEFALLALVAEAAAAPQMVDSLLLALGAGGIGGAALAAGFARHYDGRQLLAWLFRACGAAAIATLFARGPATMAAAALLVGLSLGSLTVVLSSQLRGAAGGRHLGLCIGAGTGLAYALCNLPIVFRAPPIAQALMAAFVAGAASLVPRWMTPADPSEPARQEKEWGSVVRWLVVLLALVWMDSAAFFIVQHTPSLQAANWGTDASLIANAIVHFLFAIVAGVMLDRGQRRLVAAISIVALAMACLILNETVKLPAPAGWFYTAGVSFYSVALVEFPARMVRPSVAALVFGIAGWLGSALGIGMAQDLARVPGSFVFVACAVVVVSLAWRPRLGHATVVLLLGMLGVGSGELRAEDISALVARGREVYIGEGCIHCHSQYVRPRAPHEAERWGPARPLSETLSAAPPLIGTRRQGPDLANVGNRRSLEWNRLHLIEPRSVSPDSRMPSYGHLFAGGDARGDALLAYLASLGAETREQRRAQILDWVPERKDVLNANEARRLFSRSCANCHGVSGHGDGAMAAKLSVRPPDWSWMPFRHVRPDEDLEIALSRIIKFGLPGLPMAGHEYLADREVVALARFVQTLRSAQEASPAGQP